MTPLSVWTFGRIALDTTSRSLAHRQRGASDVSGSFGRASARTHGHWPALQKENWSDMAFESVNSVSEIRTGCTLTKEQLYDVLLDWSYGKWSLGSVIGSLAMQRVETPKDSRQISLNFFKRVSLEEDLETSTLLT